MIKIRFRSIKLMDLSIFFAIFITLAFHNYTAVLIIAQATCFLIMAIKKFKARSIPKPQAKYHIWMVLFTLTCVMSYFQAIHPERVVSSILSIIQVWLMGTAILLYNNTRENSIKLLRFISLGCYGIIARMVIQVPVNAWGTERVGNYLGYGNNGASTALIYVAIFMFYLFRISKDSKDRYYSIVTMVLCILFSLLCGSKKAVIVAALGIGLQLAFSSKKPAQFVLRLLLAIGLGFGLYTAIMNVDILYNALGRRIQYMLFAFSGSDGGDASTLDRIAFARQAIEVFHNHPIFGVGLDNFRYYNFKQFYSHNNYLELATGLGVFGVIAYYWFPFSILKNSLIRRNNPSCLMIASFMLTILLMDIATVSYSIDSLQIYIAFAYSMLVLEIQEQKCEVEKHG